MNGWIRKSVISLILGSLFALLEVFYLGKFNVGRPPGLEVDVYTTSNPGYISISFFISKVIIYAIIFLMFFYLEFTMKEWMKKGIISLIIACFLSLIIVFARYKMEVLQNPVYDFVFLTLSIAAFLLALYVSIDFISKTFSAKKSFTGMEKFGLLLQIISILLIFISGIREAIVFIGPILCLIIGPISYRQTHHAISRAFFLWGLALCFWAKVNPILGGGGIVTETPIISML